MKRSIEKKQREVSEYARAIWRETIKKAQAAHLPPNPIGPVLLQEHENGATFDALADKHGLSRGSVAGMVWRERRARKGLCRSPHNQKAVSPQQQRSETISLPVVKWGKG